MHEPKDIRESLEQILALANCSADNGQNANGTGSCDGCPASYGEDLCAFEEIIEVAMRAAENYGEGGA